MICGQFSQIDTISNHTNATCISRMNESHVAAVQTLFYASCKIQTSSSSSLYYKPANALLGVVEPPTYDDVIE